MDYNPQAPIGTPFNPLIYAFPPDYLYMPTYEWQSAGGVLFDPFWLVFPTFGPMTAALQQTQQVVVPNDADFEMRRIMFHLDAAGAQQTQALTAIPNITIMITDAGSGRNLMNAAAPLNSIANNEGLGGATDLCWPKIFSRNSTIQVQLTNFDAAVVTNNVRITFCGRKIFSK